MTEADVDAEIKRLHQKAKDRSLPSYHRQKAWENLVTLIKVKLEFIYKKAGAK